VRKDVFTGKTGYTLAAALMFGSDEIIQSVAPGYRFDALLRRRDMERYDDRLIVRTNLIDAFDLLMSFVEKHLDDPFYLEGATTVSLRARIFRELVANIVAHREYTSAAPATMVIYKDRVEFKNPNVPHGRGPIDPAHFTPYPKNPTICKFLIQLGRYEELGSGVNNVTKYLPFYAPGTGAPSFIKDDMFTTIVPLAPVASEVTEQVTPQVTPQVGKLLEALQGEMRSGELMEKLRLKDRMHFRMDYLQPALAAELIQMTIPDKPRSSKQKYRLTDKGRQAMRQQGGGGK
jgi:ATP-dependent DNA helicase RecG